MSGHLALVVDRAGAQLEKGTHDTVVLTHADGQRERIGLRALGAVVLHGDVKLSTAVVQALTQHDIALTMLPKRGPVPSVTLARAPDRQLLLRHQQHLAYATAERRLALARCVLLAKLESLAACAHGHAAAVERDHWRAMQAAARATDVPALMGIEGAAAVKHFAMLGTLYGDAGPFVFNGRSRRPPRDPVNALTSLSYTLAQGQATPLLVQAGLDAQLGFLHSPHHDRAALALDLIEPARAVLDDWVYELLVRKRVLTPASFTQSAQSGVRLDAEGRALFYSAWYRTGCRLALAPMRALLSALQQQLRAGAADVFLTDAPASTPDQRGPLEAT